MIGVSNKIFKSLMPFVTALDIKSKCFVSPFIKLPIAIIESGLSFIASLHPNISSKLPETLILIIFLLLTPSSFSF